MNGKAINKLILAVLASQDILKSSHLQLSQSSAKRTQKEEKGQSLQNGREKSTQPNRVIDSKQKRRHKRSPCPYTPKDINHWVTDWAIEVPRGCLNNGQHWEEEQDPPTRHDHFPRTDLFWFASLSLSVRPTFDIPTNSPRSMGSSFSQLSVFVLLMGHTWHTRKNWQPRAVVQCFYWIVIG